jgi:hypothetical protein
LLSNLFRLDGTPAVVAPNSAMPSMSPDNVVLNIVFQPGGWKTTSNLRKVTFRGVAFSKVTVSQVTFNDCRFEDCLFLGTQFNEVEFHGCSFVDCNFWKARFTQVYLDPDCIKLDRRFKIEAANIGISVFQALLSNFANERQDQFYMTADMHFRRWKRYQIWYDFRRKRLTRTAALWRWSSSIIYERLAGFGYRPMRFFCATMVLFLAVSCMNYWLIGNAVEIGNVRAYYASFVDVVFYTFSIMTVLGFSSIIPVTDGAKILTVFETLAVIGWLGMFTSILVKRFLR